MNYTSNACKHQGSLRPSFSLPASFEPADILPPGLTNRADDARWLMSTILQKMLHGDIDEHGFVHLHSSILKRVMGKRSYATIVRVLDNAEVLERSGYRPGAWSRGFRLPDRLLAEPMVRMRATDRKLIARINREYERMRKEQLLVRLPIHDQLERGLSSLAILPVADEIVAALGANSRLCQESLVDKIRRGDFTVTLSSTGRLFSPFTGLKRNLRAYVRLEGDPISGVDIRCATRPIVAMHTPL